MKDKIISAVPSKVANFQMEQGAFYLDDLESKGTAYFSAKKDVFAGGMLSELKVGAAASYQSKQQRGKT